MPEICPQCGPDGIIQHDPSEGTAFCINCGAVVAQNTLSAEIAFGESSSGAAIVQGSYVANNATGAAMSRPGARHVNIESREATLQNGRRAIQNLAFTMSISTTLADNAARWYNLAVANDFTKGRKANYVIAACLYVACRKNKHPAMLIDFSDKLRVNVFELGSTYLKLVRKLNIPDIPLIDPSIYISRFAALLEFGDDTQRVAHDAARLASRFERDWMQTGRRPSGICGACLILAARMNNFRRSIAEIVQVVKIADVTLKKRLQEFQATKSGSLTVDEFRKVWLQEEDKPPAMLKNEQKERERIKALAAAAEAAARGEGSDESEDEDDSASKNPKKRKLTSKEMLAEKRQRMRSGDSATPMRGSSLAPLTPSRKFLPSPSPFDRGEASMSPGAAFASFQGELNRLETVDGQASGSSPAPGAQAASTEQDILDRLAAVRSGEDGDETDLLEQQANGKEKTDELDLPLVDEAVTGEILDYMAQQKPASLAEELELAEQRRLRDLEDRIAAQGDEDELKGLDEDELDAYLLDERQIAAKTIIWNKFNHEYMVKLNERNAKKAGEAESQKKPKRKRSRIGPAASASEAAINLVRQKRFSRKINYDNIKKLLDEDDEADQPLRRMSSLAPSVNEKSDQRFNDDKEDEHSNKGEDMEIVEEEGVDAPRLLPGDDTLLEEEEDEDDPMVRMRRQMEQEEEEGFAEEY